MRTIWNLQLSRADCSHERQGLLPKIARANPLLSKEGQSRSAGVVCSKTRSHLIDVREALLINRYCSSVNRPPQPSLCEGIPALLRRGMAQFRKPVGGVSFRADNPPGLALK
jgi:hypothetical protein